LEEDSTSVIGVGRERAHQLWVSSKGGAPSTEGGFILSEENRFWELQVLVFPCGHQIIILGGFWRYFGGGFICIESGTISQEEGAPHFGGLLDPCVYQVFFLLEHLGFHCHAPIYHSSGLMELLEVSRREAKLYRV
jgi:hypothetical protein